MGTKDKQEKGKGNEKRPKVELSFPERSKKKAIGGNNMHKAMMIKNEYLCSVDCLIIQGKEKERGRTRLRTKKRSRKGLHGTGVKCKSKLF